MNAQTFARRARTISCWSVALAAAAVLAERPMAWFWLILVVIASQPFMLTRIASDQMEKSLREERRIETEATHAWISGILWIGGCALIDAILISMILDILKFDLIIVFFAFTAFSMHVEEVVFAIIAIIRARKKKNGPPSS